MIGRALTNLPGTIPAALALVLFLAGCTGQAEPIGEEPTTMRLTSPAFEDGGSIPSRHTCDGEDLSPPLAWDEAPDRTSAFVLVVDDPDAHGFLHWLLTDIPGDARELPEGAGDAIGMPGRNDFGRTGWAGPCPPSGEHRYVFTLYALSEPMQMEADAETDAAAIRDAISPRLLAEGRLTGVYERRR